MMRVPCPCSMAVGIAVVSVLGHKWSQLAGPRYPRLAASDPNSRPALRRTCLGRRPQRVPVGAGRSPRTGRRAHQAGCRFPVSGRAAEPMRTPPKRAPLPFRAGRYVRDLGAGCCCARPDTRQLAECIALSDRVVLDNAPAPRYACRLRCRGGPSCCAERGVLLSVPSPAARAGRLGFWLPGGRAVVM